MKPKTDFIHRTRRLVLPLLLVAALAILIPRFSSEAAPVPEVQQWTVHEIDLSTPSKYDNPYTEVEVWAVFVNEKGDSLLRPGFWDGGNSWKIRFAPPDTGRVWTWETRSSNQDGGLHGQQGQLRSVPYTGSNALLRHGLLGMSPGGRNVVHKDGRAFLVVGDTPWALPFRATTEQARRYAANRQQKGFNTALLMSLQPDMRADGPDARNTPQGFARAFSDLPQGHIREMNAAYFQYLDSLVAILTEHGIVPVFQPVFHGYGWKGLDVLGNTIDPDEYVRYCKYLLARYGSQPAFWLLAGDNGGRDPGVKESGEMMEQWDCYQQPTGLHYNPCDDYIAEWAVNNPLKHCEHYNKAWQEEVWLDFQWAQTGHSNEHLYHKVQRMYDNLPVKAAANGEPTYEGMNGGKNGLGWWQGEEAWMQLMSGGTMGAVYGAATLWQWKVSPDETGWPTWTDQPMSWEQALEMEGSRYVGFVSRAFVGYDFADMEKRPDLPETGGYLLAVAGKFYVSYLPEGGEIRISSLPAGLPWQWFNPIKGTFHAGGTTASGQTFVAPDALPWVLLVGEKER